MTSYCWFTVDTMCKTSRNERQTEKEMETSATAPQFLKLVIVVVARARKATSNIQWSGKTIGDI